MKLKNTITDNIFDISAEDGKKLLDEYDCFEVVEVEAAEKKVLSQKAKKPLSVRDKVLKNVEFRM